MLANYAKTLLSLSFAWFILAGCRPAGTDNQTAEETAPPHNTPASLNVQLLPTPTATQIQEPTPITYTLPKGPDAVWQLVVIGDSSLWGLGEAYARQIERDMGVKVELYDCTVSTLSAVEVLGALDTGKSRDLMLKNLPPYLEQAEVVVMFANPNDSPNPQANTDIDKCFRNLPVDSCPPQAFDIYTTDMQAIWEKILELRQGQPTILRAVDFYTPFVEPWQESGAFDSCTACWETFSQATHQAAEANGIPFLSRFDAFSGPAHDEDPRAKGLIDADGVHPSPQAAELTAQLLGEMGYEPTLRKED
jgi:lysophospholipase L1-like esterase